MCQYKFNTLFDGSKRPPEYGDVTIVYEIINPGTKFEWRRPTLAFGCIYPLDSTKGRKTAPEPLSGFRISNTKRVPKKALALSMRNTGRVDMDKGHIFALELGGPDVPANICPQWSQFQRNGEWRQMETDAYDIAAQQGELGNLVHMRVEIFYSGAQSLSRAGAPQRFCVKLFVVGANNLLREWRIDNTHSATDDMMFERQANVIDPLGSGSRSMSESVELARPSLSTSGSEEMICSFINDRRSSIGWSEYVDRASDSDDDDWAEESFGSE